MTTTFFRIKHTGEIIKATTPAALAKLERQMFIFSTLEPVTPAEAKKLIYIKINDLY
jgi:hypothetical protein